MTEVIPSEVVEALGRAPLDGVWSDVFLLITVGEEGEPRIAFLSSAELRVARDRILTVVRTGMTTGNLLRSRRATLVVVLHDSAWCGHLEVVGTDESCPGLVGLMFRLRSAKRDSVGVRLKPLQFLGTDKLRAQERRDEVGTVMARLTDQLE